MSSVLPAGVRKNPPVERRPVMSITMYKPNQIATLLRQIEVVHFTTGFGPSLIPATDLGF